MLAQPTIPLNVFMLHGLVDCKTELLPGINKDILILILKL